MIGDAMTFAYRVEAGHSQFTVHAFSGGMLSFMAHNPTFAVRNFGGDLRWNSASPSELQMELVVSADSLELVDQVRPADREDIMERMRREVLETAVYPEIRFEATSGSATRLAAEHLEEAGRRAP